MELLSKPKICVSVKVEDTKEVLKTINRIKRYNPDFIELRLDYAVRSLDLGKVQGVTCSPLIATNRGKKMGGQSDASEEERICVLLDACSAGFSYIDLSQRNKNLSDNVARLKEEGAKIILSYHDFNGMPNKDEMNKIYSRAKKLGGDICKIVGTARGYEENLRCLDFLTESKAGDLICFAMGKKGMLSRLFSPLYGGIFTYASTMSGKETAEGQLSIQDIRELYRIIGV